MSWHIPPLVPQALPSPPRQMRWLAALMAMMTLATILTLLLWPVGASQRVLLFWICILVLPTLLWAIALVGRLVVFAMNRNWVAVTNDTLAKELARWHRWAGQRMAVLAVASVTPEADLIPRLTGVQLPAPFNPGRALQLAQFSGEQRQAPVLSSLLEQIAPALEKISGRVVVHVYLSGEQPSANALLQLSAAWDKARIGVKPDFIIQPTLPVLPDDWLATSDPTPHLLLGIQLAAASTEVTLTENGFALLLASPESKASTATAPLAWLYRAMPTAENSIESDFAELLQIQRPAKSIRALWSIGVPQKPLDQLMAATSAHKLNLDTAEGRAAPCVLDQALGPCGVVGAGLCVALATEALQLGDHTRLIALADPGATTIFHLLEPA